MEGWPYITIAQMLHSYYRRYIHHFADIAGPLHQLTYKGLPFTWSAEWQEAFKQLKEALSTASVLAYPHFRANADQFVLHTDASESGLGWVLKQDNRVVAYASKSSTNVENCYSVIQKECLAIVFGTKQFRHYLLGRSFKLYTDHAPLQWFSK